MYVFVLTCTRHTSPTPDRKPCISVIQVRTDQSLVVQIRCPMRSLKPEDKAFLIFFANPGRGGPKKAGWYWMLRPPVSWIYKKFKTCFVLWLLGPHGTPNFDHQTLIRSDLNYTNTDF